MKTPAFWQHQTIIARLLVTCSLLYYLASRLHSCWRKWRGSPKKLNQPVICVGNVVTGGAGKTPTVRMLSTLLKIAGQEPHVISRGYGGKPQKAPLRVDPMKHTAAEVGDEPLLLAQTAPSWVCLNRQAAAAAAISKGATVIIADDGLQNPTFHKDISLLVMDSDYGVGNGFMLPAGPLREPLWEGLQRSDAVILIGKGGFYPSTLKPVWHAQIISVTDFSDLTGTPVIAFAGIARPQKFFNNLAAQGLKLVEKLEYPDHHSYSEADISALLTKAETAKATLITTAKDYVKLPASFAERCRVADVKLQLEKPQEFLSWLGERFTYG